MREAENNWENFEFLTMFKITHNIFIFKRLYMRKFNIQRIILKNLFLRILSLIYLNGVGNQILSRHRNGEVKINS